MPPKQVEADPKVVADLKSIVGLDDKNATDLAGKSADRAAEVLAYFADHKISADTDRAAKIMLYATWTKTPSKPCRDYIATRILDGGLKSTQQTDAAVRFVAKKPVAGAVDAAYTAEFDSECGVGVVVTADQVKTEVMKTLRGMEPTSVKANWVKAQAGPFLGLLKKVDALRWADWTYIKTVVEEEAPKIAATVADEESSAAAATSAAAAAASAGDKKKKEDKIFLPELDYKPFMAAPRTWLKDLAQVPAGQSVTILGWAHKVRHQRSLSFCVLRDTTGFVQIVFEGNVPEFARETSLAITGVVKDEPKAAVDGQPPKEIKVTSFAIVGPSNADIENVVTADSGLDLQYDQRHIVIRGKAGANALKIRSFTVQAFREHFFSKGLFEVQPPTIVQAQAEGGAQLFNVDYYGEKAYMTQSSQLYLETCLSSVGDVFCILPSYRAENQRTHRHLAEFTHIEGEYGFITYEDLLSRLEDLVTDVFDKVIRRCGDLVAELNPEQLVDKDADPKDPASWKNRPSKPFVRLPYHKAIDKCNELGILNTAEDPVRKFEYGDDITDAPERQLVAHYGTVVMMTHFPRIMKAFYMQPDEKDPDLTESVDILVPGVGEIVGGSMRMIDYETLVEAYKKNDLDPAPYYWYTDQRKYGTCPHGGFGLGLERFIRWMCNMYSIRDATLFPRYMGRCQP